MNALLVESSEKIFKKIKPDISQGAFNGDLFNRKELAEKLESCILCLKDGSVIGIDATWGNGKTWFAQHWHKSLLSNDKFIPIYLDAFENDYSDDPFIIITSKILEKIGKSRLKDSILENAAQVAKILTPSVLKFGANAVINWVFGTKDMSEKIENIKEECVEAVSGLTKFYMNRLEDHQNSKAIIDGFKSKISDYLSENDKTMIFIIDELDRCKPSFSVQLLERLKHLFDIPNIAFVLMVNKDQLQKSIQGIYGQSTDGHSYLGKFVDFFIPLPRSLFDKDYKGYCNNFLLPHYSLQNNHQQPHDFINAFSGCAYLLDLSLRDLEKGFLLYALHKHVIEEKYQVKKIGSLSQIFGYIVAIKLSSSSIYGLLINNLKNGHEKAIFLFEEFKLKLPEKENILANITIQIMIDFHNLSLKKDNYTPSEHFDALKEMVQPHDIMDIIKDLMNMASLSIT